MWGKFISMIQALSSADADEDVSAPADEVDMPVWVAAIFTVLLLILIVATPWPDTVF